MQYLPLLYLSKDDTLLVTERLSERYLDRLKSFGITTPPRVVTYEDPFPSDIDRVESWGVSELVKGFAREHRLAYDCAPISLVRRLSSKLETFQMGPKLRGASVIRSLSDLERVDFNLSKNFVLKTAHGFAGRGHCIFNRGSLAKAYNFLDAARGEYLLLEPWVERVVDFSSQWRLESSVELVGVTRFFNKPSGEYLGTAIGSPDVILKGFDGFVKEHLHFCQKIVEELFCNGYRGVLGVDAMVYRHPDNQECVLKPLVEINPRHTVSYAFLMLQKRYFKNKTLKIEFYYDETGCSGLLPDGFKRQIRITDFVL